MNGLGKAYDEKEGWMKSYMDEIAPSIAKS
jgi:hypothetical protein